MEDTSWEKGASWYDSLTTKSGHFYHSNVIFPKIKQLMQLEKSENPSVLEIGCGQGALARACLSKISYLGLDTSETLLLFARKRQKNPLHKFILQDATQAYTFNQKFSHVIFLLSLQNINDPKMALKQAGKHVRPTGKLILVLNHPCFRIPRQSCWGIDPKQKIQYRRINKYSSAMKIPIEIHPGKKEGGKNILWAFHLPLAQYFEYIKEAGLTVSELHEWYCPKISSGKNAKMENNARKEFPLFLTIVANPSYQVC